MDPRALVRPLEASWKAILDRVLPARMDLARLASKVEELSLAYNEGLVEGRRTKLPVEARVAFSFPRDVPKGAAAVRELVASGALSIPNDRPLRVLDLGAGLGAMTWGLARALAASGATGRIEAVLVDEDEQILETASKLARVATATNKEELGLGAVDLVVTTRVQALRTARSSPMTTKADVVLLGQVLSEIDPRSEPEPRIVDHSALLIDLLSNVVTEDGALVVIEPALRERTRHLHAVRDRVLATMPRASVFAPCLHRANCPALAFEREWCHEDLPIDLPSWVVPLARAAGLRWQGLTFAYLVLRQDGRRLLAGGTPDDDDDKVVVRLRVISDLLPSKGKTELFACMESAVRSRLRRLDRDAGMEQGLSFLELRRGDIVSLRASKPEEASLMADAVSPIDDRGRVKPHVTIDVGGFGK